MLFDWELPRSVIDLVLLMVDVVLVYCGIYDVFVLIWEVFDCIECEFFEYDYCLELLFVIVFILLEFMLL